MAAPQLKGATEFTKGEGPAPAAVTDGRCNPGEHVAPHSVPFPLTSPMPGAWPPSGLTGKPRS